MSWRSLKTARRSSSRRGGAATLRVFPAAAEHLGQGLTTASGPTSSTIPPVPAAVSPRFARHSGHWQSSSSPSPIRDGCGEIPLASSTLHHSVDLSRRHGDVRPRRDSTSPASRLAPFADCCNRSRSCWRRASSEAAARHRAPGVRHPSAASSAPAGTGIGPAFCGSFSPAARDREGEREIFLPQGRLAERRQSARDRQDVPAGQFVDAFVRTNAMRNPHRHAHVVAQRADAAECRKRRRSALRLGSAERLSCSRTSRHHLEQQKLGGRFICPETAPPPQGASSARVSPAQASKTTQRSAATKCRTVALLRLRQRFDLAQFVLRQMGLLLRRCRTAIDTSRRSRAWRTSGFRPSSRSARSMSLNAFCRAFLLSADCIRRSRGGCRWAGPPPTFGDISWRVLSAHEPALEVLRAGIGLASPLQQRVRAQKIAIRLAGSINSRISGGWPL